MCAGMYAGRSMLKTVVLERGMPGGELLNTEMIEDYPASSTSSAVSWPSKFEDHARSSAPSSARRHRATA